MIWKLPPRIKIFEALGAIADERIQRTDTGASVASSDASKTYLVKYDETRNMIAADDNGSKWQGHLGYPSIALLMKQGKLSFDQSLADGLKGIEWKKINTQYKNDWDKVESWLFETRDKEKLISFATKVLDEIQSASLHRFQ
jgi:hypothetical protein